VLAFALCALLPASNAVGDTSSTSSPTSSTSTGGGPTPAPTLPKGGASATLEQCATAVAPQTERSATFAGEMAATANTARMEMRVQLEEQAGDATGYHTVVALGLGVWQRSNSGVKSFTHIQQVTDLSSPALYRGSIRFRWLNARGRAIKTQELHTASCEQPTASSPPVGGESTSSGVAS
jgi:hypothetical protein